MEPAGPTAPDESTVLSEYCMDGEAHSPHRNLPYPDGTLDVSSVRSEYYPTAKTEEDGTTGSSDSNLDTTSGYSGVDALFRSSDSPLHTFHPRDYNTPNRWMHQSSYSTSSSDSYSSSGWDMEPAHVSSFAYQPFSEDESSSWVESVELMQPDGLLTDVIPSPYCDLVFSSLEGKPKYTPVQLYAALGNAIDEVSVQEKWSVAKAEDPLERISRIKKLKADDEIRSAAAVPEAFSRACGVCYADAPATRAVLTACGHLVCAPCAETIADGGGRLVCPYCRANTGYVFVVEEKEGSLATDDDLRDAETNEKIDNGF